MTVYLLISLPKILYINPIYMILAKPSQKVVSKSKILTEAEAEAARCCSVQHSPPFSKLFPCGVPCRNAQQPQHSVLCLQLELSGCLTQLLVTIAIHRSALHDIHRIALRDIHRSALHDIHRSALHDIHRSALHDIHRSALHDIHRSALHDIHRSALQDIHRSALHDIHRSALHDSECLMDLAYLPL